MEEIKIVCSYSKLVPVEDLKPHPRNSNQHPIEQLERFAKVLRAKKKWRFAIVVSNQSGLIISGHGRREVAMMLGMTEVPVDYQDFNGEADEIEQLTFDNEIARWAQLDRHSIHLALEEVPNVNIENMGIEHWKPKAPKLDLSGKNKEIDTGSFGSDLQHTCPKCNYEFDD